MAPKRAFVALQDRFVSSLAVACCPTMDLIAVLTLDHHLLVHVTLMKLILQRTTSWQKLLHIKPSDIGFQIVAMVWNPDGLQLAVGSDEGNVTIFDIESGNPVPERRISAGHKSCITAMDWVHVEVIKTSLMTNQRCKKAVGTSKDSSSQSARQFRHRSSRFLKGFKKESETDVTVLVTADDQGVIVLWWRGKVLMTRIDVSKHFTEKEFEIMKIMGYERDGISGFRIKRVNLAPDFSLLYILLAISSATNHQKQDNTALDQSEKKIQRLLTLNIIEIQSVYMDVALVATTIDRAHAIVSRITTVSRQMATEWKNSMRLFELKMGLMGSLYEKYACEDPPQVDMLSMVVTGITAPALAQYFAQDIQEMSVHRMQKALVTGCEKLRVLVENMKSDLVDVLFLVSELRGHIKWNPQTYASTMGIKLNALDALIKLMQNILVKMEALTLALYETRQDFTLFFQWILERICDHKNAFQSGERTQASARDVGGTVHGTNSLLNLRRLCDFLDHAATIAKDFWRQQPNGSEYTIETSFGNSVSQQLSTLPKSLTDDSGRSSKGCLGLIQSLQEKWSFMLNAIDTTLTLSVVRENSGCFTVGTSSIVECHVRFRQHFSSKRCEDIEDARDQSEDEESEDEAVEWQALKHYRPRQNSCHNGSTILIGFRLRSGNLILLKQVESQRDQSFCLRWETAVVSFTQGSLGPRNCQGFDFYGHAPRKRTERLALVVDRIGENQVLEDGAEWLILQQYDHIRFAPFNPTISLEAVAQHQSHMFQFDEHQGRKVVSLPAIVHPNKRATSVIATASRGILCVLLPPSRLIVYDAEDSEDEEDTSD